MSRKRTGLYLSTLLATTGCFQLSADDKHACDKDSDCLHGRVCVENICTGHTPNDADEDGGLDIPFDDAGDGDDASVGDAGEKPEKPVPPDDAGAPEYPSLVLKVQESEVSSLFAVDLAEGGAVRKLDPNVTATRSIAEILGYSPRGDVLLYREKRDGQDTYYATRFCRMSSCANAAPVSFELLSQPSASDSWAPPPTFFFSPNERAVVLILSDGAHYLTLETLPILREHKVFASAGPFIAGGAGLIAGVDGQVRIYKTANMGEEPLSLAPTLPTDANSGVASVSPDGSHFVAQADGDVARAFDSAEAMAGNATGRAIDGDPMHWNDTWLVLRTQSGLFAERWDGSDRQVLDGLDKWSTSACGDYLVSHGSSPEQMLVAQLPRVGEDIDQVQIRTVDAPLGSPFLFSKDCSRARGITYGSVPDVLLDLETLEVSRSTSFQRGTMSADGTLFTFGTGIAAVYRADPPGDPKVVYSPVMQITNAWQPTLANHSPMFLVAGPLEGWESSSLFRVDVSNVDEPVVTRLIDSHVGSARVLLSANDRFAAFLADHPGRVFHEWDEDLPGIYETDLSTNTTTRVVRPKRQLSGGPLLARPVPGGEKLVVIGQYGPDDYTSLFTVGLDDAGGWQPRLTGERANWLVHHDVPMALSADGRLVAFIATGPEGPRTIVQMLSEAEAEVAADQPGGNIYGFAGSLGLVLHGAGGLQRINPVSGAATLLPSQLRGLPGEVLTSEQHNRIIVLTPDPGSLAYRIEFLEASDPGQSITVATGLGATQLMLSADERFLLYATDLRESDSEATYAVHVYDLQARKDYLLDEKLRFSQVAYPNVALFAADGQSALLRSLDGGVYRLDLESKPRLTLITKISDLSYRQLTADRDLNHAVLSGEFGSPSKLLDARNESAVLELKIGGKPATAQLSPDGKRLLMFSETGEAYLANVTDLEAAPKMLAGYNQHFLTFDPTGEFLVGLGMPTLVWKASEPDAPESIDVVGTVVEAVWIAPPTAAP